MKRDIDPLPQANARVSRRLAIQKVYRLFIVVNGGSLLDFIAEYNP